MTPHKNRPPVCGRLQKRSCSREEKGKAACNGEEISSAGVFYNFGQWKARKISSKRRGYILTCYYSQPPLRHSEIPPPQAALLPLSRLISSCPGGSCFAGRIQMKKNLLRASSTRIFLHLNPAVNSNYVKKQFLYRALDDILALW